MSCTSDYQTSRPLVDDYGAQTGAVNSLSSSLFSDKRGREDKDGQRGCACVSDLYSKSLEKQCTVLCSGLSEGYCR